MMKIEIRSKDLSITDAMRQHVERQLGFALDRFRNFRQVVVWLGDLNGPKGGPDKFCRIVAEYGFAAIVVEEIQANIYVAISRASHRLAQQVARELGRLNRPATRAANSIRKGPSRLSAKKRRISMQGHNPDRSSDQGEAQSPVN